MRRLLGIAVLAIALGGCQEAPGGQESPSPVSSPSPTDDYAGRELVVYETALDVCGSVSAQELARELGVEGTDPDSLAYAYAYGGTNEPWAEAPAYDGCLEALL